MTKYTFWRSYKTISVRWYLLRISILSAAHHFTSIFVQLLVLKLENHAKKCIKPTKESCQQKQLFASLYFKFPWSECQSQVFNLHGQCSLQSMVDYMFVVIFCPFNMECNHGLRSMIFYDELVIRECDSRHSLSLYFFGYPNLTRYHTILIILHFGTNYII